MKATEVTEPGYYWVRKTVGQWDIIEVVDTKCGLEFWLIGNEADFLPSEIDGQVFGPIPNPVIWDGKLSR